MGKYTKGDRRMRGGGDIVSDEMSVPVCLKREREKKERRERGGREREKKERRERGGR